VSILSSKASTAADLRKQIAWLETQTDQRVQRVRHDRGGEYMSHAQQEWYAEKGIQQEPTAGYSPEANGLAERHNLTLLDMAMPMLADSADASFGLPPLSTEH
jgi:transposase InsO family protein